MMAFGFALGLCVALAASFFGYGDFRTGLEVLILGVVMFVTGTSIVKWAVKQS